MDVTPLVKEGAQIIQSYADGGFKISGTRYEGAVLVTPEDVKPWAIESFEALSVVDFQSIKADVILLGTGAKMHFLPAELKQALSQEGLYLDVMDTAAACRTYNVLMTEDRDVIAALLPV